MGKLQDDMIVYRAKERITQKELGRRCGLTAQTIMNIENGKITPSKTTYARVRLVVKGSEEVKE